MRKKSYTKEDLLECANGKIFTHDTPRLPVPPMLMFDRILEINNTDGAFKKGKIHAELDVMESLWFFKCHFRDDPVMPGCLGLDALWQLLGFFLGWLGYYGKGRALGCGDIKFTGQVLPENKKVSYYIDVKRVIARNVAIVSADGELAVDNKVIYTAKDLRVGLFKDKD